MSRIWAVARHMIAECIRTRTALVIIVILVGFLAVAPFVLQGDGLTLRSRVQSYLAYSLGLSGVLLSLMTVVLACGALVDEIRGKQIYMIASKPIPRWQFFFGKWLGISLLNFGLLFVVWVTILGFVWYLGRQPTQVPFDRARLEKQVLTIHHGFTRAEPNWDERVEDRIRQLRMAGQWEEVDERTDHLRAEEIKTDLKRRWRTMGPREGIELEFTGLLDRFVDRQSEAMLFLVFKPVSPSGAADVLFDAMWQAGDLRDPNTIQPEVTARLPVDRMQEIPISARAVNDRGVLYVRLANLSSRDVITFDWETEVELLYPIGTFPWNTFRAIMIIWCRLAFLAAVGLLLSSFLTFPVACMGCFLVLAVSSAAGWLREAVDWSLTGPVKDRSLGPLGVVLEPIAMGFVRLVPDFSRFDAVGNVVEGRLVPLTWVILSMAALVFVQGLIVMIIGSVIFTKRELAQVTV